MLVYLLLHIIPYHGGTRGMELGIYDSEEQCLKAWKKYKRYRLTKEERLELQNDICSDNYGKIVSFSLNHKPKEWAGNTVQEYLV